MSTKILVNRYDATDVENEEKIKWALDVLLFMGITADELNVTDHSMENLRKMRGFLKKLEIDIIDDSNNGIKIYYQHELVAEWIKPTYVLKEDLKEIDPKYRYFLEMTLNHRSVFDEHK